MNQAKVLIVEDDPALSEALGDTLEFAGYNVVSAPDGRVAQQVLTAQPIDLVVSDVQMQHMDGHALLRHVRLRYPDLPMLLMTAYGTIENAVQAIRGGAVDYLVKPFEAEVLVKSVDQLLANRCTDQCAPVAEDVRSREVVQLARRVADSEATVMIGGESGTGKEVIARYIHTNSRRHDGPFVAINCAAIPGNMLESVLFGYEKGAFTGAYKAAPGKFEQAQGGTLLLDEVSEMDFSLQAKLLRVLQEREVERLGSQSLIELDVRVLATTNRNLREEVAAGRFREDLFYRLNVFPLALPALRERPRDILPLAQRLLERHTEPGKPLPPLSAEAESALLAHPWPGNVRELENVIQRALILNNGTAITAADLHFEGTACSRVEDDINEEISESSCLGSDLRSRENQLILDALEQERGCRKTTAERLGISQRTLRYKLARLRDAGVAIPG